MSISNTLNFILTHPLNKNNKYNSLIRFLQWQIGSRLISNDIVYQWINNCKFLVKAGETGLTGNIYTGLHELSDMGYLIHVLRNDDIFADIGANVGSYTILAGAVVGAKGYAFEPIPTTYQRLIENIRINHLEDSIKSFNLALGDKIGSIALTADLDTTNHVITSEEGNLKQINVDISTLDSIVEHNFPSFMKIDVEGYETIVLKGANETLKQKKLHSVIMELNGSGNRYGFDESKIIEMMLDNGFGTYSYNPLTRTLVDLEGKNIASGNTIFIKDKSLVLERIKTAPIITINNISF